MCTPPAPTASMIQSLEAEEARKVGVRGTEEAVEEETKSPGDPAEKVAEEETRAPLLEDREVEEGTQETVNTRRTLPAGTFLAKPAKIIQHSP